MQTPLFADLRQLATIGALMLGLALPGLARAEQNSKQRTPSDQSALPTSQPSSEEDRLRVLAILTSTMLWSGEFPPPDNIPSMIVKPPRRPPRDHHPQGGGGNPTTASISPEPSSVCSGLLGSGMAWFYAWMRKRRRDRANRGEAEVEAERKGY